MKNLITIRRLEARYGDFQALFGIDMDVGEGDSDRASGDSKRRGPSRRVSRVARGELHFGPDIGCGRGTVFPPALALRMVVGAETQRRADSLESALWVCC